MALREAKLLQLEEFGVASRPLPSYPSQVEDLFRAKGPTLRLRSVNSATLPPRDEIIVYPYRREIEPCSYFETRNEISYLRKKKKVYIYFLHFRRIIL